MRGQPFVEDERVGGNGMEYVSSLKSLEMDGLWFFQVGL